MAMGLKRGWRGNGPITFVFLTNSVALDLMGLRLMARKTPAMVKLARIEARTKTINGLRQFVFVVFCAAGGFLCVAMALPQRDKLEDMETRLEDAKHRETLALEERDNYLTENRAIKEDPAFLEVHARDRLDRYREGEKVLKFRKERH